MRPRAPIPSTAAAAVPFVLVLALGAVQGGYLPDTWVWATPLAAWAAALAALLGGAGGLRRAWPWVLAALALAAWTAASALWSAVPAQSLLEARRAALYAAVVLAVAALARRCAATALVAATHAAIALLLLYALARYLLGPRVVDPFEGSLLSLPVGYANGIGALAALGILLGAGVAARETAPRTRAAAAATLPPFALALWLSQSRGGAAALAAGAVVLLALGAPREIARVTAAALPGSALAVGLAAALHLTSAAHPVSRGAEAGVAVAAAAAAAAAGFLAARTERAEPRALPPRLRAVLLALAVAVGAAAVAAAGRNGGRASYWEVAWRREIAPHPLAGTGAGSFGHAWVASGLAAARGGALDAHSLYVETAAELGVVGLLLVAAFLLLPLALAARRPPSGPLPAAAAAWAAFLVHAGVDWDWELPAIVVAALACGAALVLGDDEEPPAPAPLRGAALATALALGGVGLAGAASGTEPAAAPGTARAPQRGALALPSGREPGHLP
jgi:hypothetical protein